MSISQEATVSLGYLSDQETKVDLLNNEAIATTILRLIREKSDHPVTIGVHGDWGAGKSSVLEMVEAGLEKDERAVCLKFNGWQFQGFEDAKIALIEGVVNGLIEKRSLLTKGLDVVKDIRDQIDVLKAAKFGGKLAFTFFTGLPAIGVGEIFEAIKDKIVETFTDSEQREKALGELKELRKDGKKVAKKSVPQEIGEFRKSFKKLIEKAEVDRIVVLVDDLDRCLPETAIETLEAIRLFVFLDKTAFVIGADERMIEYAVGRHFPNLPRMEGSQGYARAYLEKLLQVPFRIPALGETETKIYVTLLLLGAVLGENDERFNRLLDLGREALGRPWEGEGIRAADITAIVGQDDKANAAFSMAERISPVLAAGTNGNPRQIKRFLNALTLRLAVAAARRFGNVIEPARLAKVMLAEMFLPEGVFPQMAASVARSPDGTCPEIAQIEAYATQEQSSDGPPTVTRDAQPGATSDSGSEGGEPARQEPEQKSETSATLADWITRPEVIRWARAKPDLAGENLKPYLFVIKDRHNYLTGATVLSSKLRALVASLAGGSMNAARDRQTIKGLSTTEVDALFKELQGQVLAAKSFDTKPPALEGLKELTEVHPGLQRRYVELLATLPVEKLGLGMASGYGFVDDPEAKRRLTEVLSGWKANGSQHLRRALEQATRKPAPRRSRSG